MSGRIKFAFLEKGTREKETINGRIEMDDARSRTVILSSFCKFPPSFLFHICTSLRSSRSRIRLFFLEQGLLTGSRKIGTYLGPLKITLPLLSSLHDLLLS